MITKNVPTYHCSYCKKYYLRRNAAAKHEEYCSNNPNNRHQCFQDCVHLKIETKEIPMDYYDAKVKVFRCDKFNKEMYSYIAERKDLLGKWPETYAGTERMPLECSDYTLKLPF